MQSTIVKFHTAEHTLVDVGAVVSVGASQNRHAPLCARMLAAACFCEWPWTQHTDVARSLQFSCCMHCIGQACVKTPTTTRCPLVYTM